MEKYNYDECKEEALKCKTRKELHEKNKTVYACIVRHKWQELFSHMNRLDHKDVELSMEYCARIIQNCKTVKEVREEYPSVYNKIFRRGWSSLMDGLERGGSKYYRSIYAYEFPEFNSAYIGLTYNMNVRNEEHHLKGTLFDFAKEHGVEIPIPKILEEHIIYSKAGVREAFFMEQYAHNGWTLINRTKAGSLGGNIIKKEEIVCFDRDGGLVKCADISYFVNIIGVKLNLIRICLRKSHNSTGGLRFYTKDEWISLGSPINIKPLVVKNASKKVILLTYNFEKIKVFETKRKCAIELGYATTNNNVMNLKPQTLSTVHKKELLCYADDYQKYIDGTYEIYKPNIPKCKNLIFVEKKLPIEFRDDEAKKILTPQKWKVNRKVKKQNIHKNNGEK